MRSMPVASYAWRHEDWLQTQRVELNSMTSPEFLAWLDGKFEGLAGKIIPPEDVLQETYAAQVQAALRRLLIEKILREAGIEAQVAEFFVRVDTAIDLREVVTTSFVTAAERRWDAPLEDHATGVAKELVPA